MTHLDSMTRRHAAGQPLTAEEVGLLLDYAKAGPWQKYEFQQKLAAPAPQPDICHWHETPNGDWQTTCLARHDGQPSSEGWCEYCFRDTQLHPVQRVLPIREVRP